MRRFACRTVPGVRSPNVKSRTQRPSLRASVSSACERTEWAMAGAPCEIGEDANLAHAVEGAKEATCPCPGQWRAGRGERLPIQLHALGRAALSAGGLS